MTEPQCRTVCPRSGSGSSGTDGNQDMTIEVFVRSGSVSTHET